MEINIISYTSEQFALLSPEQLQKVEETQIQKNKMERNLEEKIHKERMRMINNGTYFSESWPLIEAELRAECEREIEWLRDGLTFYLLYGSKTDDAGPYPLDYSLTYEERLAVVKNYYETTYVDGTERYNVFVKDDVARLYLGELYAPLRDYFHEFVG